MKQPGQPFTIAVPQDVLDDLRRRIAATRWPRAPRGPDWELGASLPYMRRVADHWLNAYDWRAVEARLNRIPQRKVTVGGIGIHVFVEQGSGPAPTPIILTHGWPGSPIELMALVEPLAHPERFGGDVAEAFTVVVPSLPGCGFSDPPDEPITPQAIAGMWGELMGREFGFERYMAHGGDWGGVITSWMGVYRPPGLFGIHLNSATMPPHPSDQADLTPPEQAFADGRRNRTVGETAYQAIQGGKPLSLAYAQADSPVGLAAWILEKFHGWTIKGQEADPPFPLDELISNVMFYWLGDAQAMSWLYRFLVDGSSFRLAQGQKVAVPAGFCVFPNEMSAPPPEAWLRRSYDQVVRYTAAPAGGHFPGLEHPGLLVDEIRAFRRQLA